MYAFVLTSTSSESTLLSIHCVVYQLKPTLSQIAIGRKNTLISERRGESIRDRCMNGLLPIQRNVQSHRFYCNTPITSLGYCVLLTVLYTHSDTAAPVALAPTQADGNDEWVY